MAAKRAAVVTDVERFITRYICKPDEHSNFYVIDHNKRLYVSDRDVQLFFAQYQQFVDDKRELSIAEVPGAMSRLVIDLDFVGDIKLTSELAKHMAGITIKALISKAGDHLPAFYFFTKPPYQKGGVTRSGIHFMSHHKYPRQLRHHVIEQIAAPIGDIMKGHAANAEQCVDMQAAYNPWLLYGSKKPGSQDNYHLERKVSIEDRRIVAALVEESPRAIDMRINFTGDVDIGYSSEEARITVESWFNAKYEEDPGVGDAIESTPFTKRTIENAVQLVRMIDAKHGCYGNGNWYKIGAALKTVYDCKLTFNGWDDFTKRARPESYNQRVCTKIWPTLEPFQAGIYFLRKLAKESSKEAYDEWRRSDFAAVITQHGKVTPWVIAGLLHMFYSGEFTYCRSNMSWYIRLLARWRCIGKDVPSTLSIAISDVFYNAIDDIVKDLRAQQQRLGGEALVQEDKESKAGKLRDQLAVMLWNRDSMRVPAFKEHTLREARVFFGEKDGEEPFIAKADTNLRYLCFENGFLDLRKIEDGIQVCEPPCVMTLTTGYNYVPEESVKADIDMLMGKLRQIHPDPARLEHILRQFASALDGNREQQGVFLIGEGRNGKSTILDLLCIALGEYSGSIPSKVLTKSAHSAQEGPTPYMAGTMGRRVIVSSEFDKTDVIDNGKFKFLTGSTYIIARFLHENPIKFLRLFKIFIDLNQLPNFGDTSEYAIERRLVFDRLLSIFLPEDELKDAIAAGKQQCYPLDPEFITAAQKRVSIRQAFMHIILGAYRRYHGISAGNAEFSDKTDLAIPIEARNDVRLYMRSQNTMDKFMANKTVRGDKTRLRDIYEKYRIWYTDSYGARSYPKTMDEMRNYLALKYSLDINTDLCPYALKPDEQ
jgi:hypothetical protein